MSDWFKFDRTYEEYMAAWRAGPEPAATPLDHRPGCECLEFGCPVGIGTHGCRCGNSHPADVAPLHPNGCCCGGCP